MAVDVQGNSHSIRKLIVTIYSYKFTNYWILHFFFFFFERLLFKFCNKHVYLYNRELFIEK